MNIKIKLEKLEKLVGSSTDNFLSQCSFPIVIVETEENEEEKTKTAVKEKCQEIASRLNISKEKAKELMDKYNLTPFVIHIVG